MDTPEAAESATARLAGVTLSAPFDEADWKSTVGAPSSSWMINVWPVVPPRVALAGALRSTRRVSSSSSVLSFTTATVMVSVVVPAANVRVPETRV